jgi:16S rRNA processing protein RimM
MSGEAERVLVARIGAPHGVRGEVRLSVFTEEPEALLAYNPLEMEDGRRLTVRRIKPAKATFVASIAGVESRAAAAALRNAPLYVPRARLPDPDEEAWYHIDLIGLSVYHVDGRKLGEVAAVQDFGAGDLLEIRLQAARRTLLVPFTRSNVPLVDVAGRRVEIDPPAGLMDEVGET